MIANITSCQTLLTTVRNLGAEPPALLAGILDAYDQMQRSRGLGDLERDLAELMSCGDLDAARFETFLDDQALRYARSQVSREVSEAAERVALQTFRAALMGQPGEELTEALTPAFNAACADLAEVIANIPPGSTAAAAIDTGPGAVAAWSKGPKVAATLDAFTRYAVIAGRDLATVCKGAHLSHPSTTIVAFFVADPATGLDAAAQAFSSAHLSDYRGGPFHSMVSQGNTSLRLNSPATAQRLLDEESHAAAERLQSEYEATHGEAVSA
jgi:hypothetical protein